MMDVQRLEKPLTGQCSRLLLLLHVQQLFLSFMSNIYSIYRTFITWNTTDDIKKLTELTDGRNALLALTRF